MSKIMDLLQARTGLLDNDLAKIVRTAPRRYKTFTVPKRSGGEREISQPARELKLLQRILMDEVLAELPVHESAKAYRKGVSIRDNAAMHSVTGPILKLDFKDFFPSIRSSDWISYCINSGILERVDAEVSAQIFFKRKKGERLLKLSIGAPSSPMLCNILMFGFDEFVKKEADRRKVNYSRYADDMTFSGQRIGILKDMIRVVEGGIRALGRPRLQLNRDKTVFVTPAVRRSVTGIVIANDGSIGLGRDRKRLISSQVHHASLGKMPREDVIRLAGILAFANVAEPSFLDWLRRKYGEKVIRGIQTSMKRRRKKKTSVDI